MFFPLTNKRKLKKNFSFANFFFLVASADQFPTSYPFRSSCCFFFFLFPLESVLSLLYLLQGLQRESKDCKKDHYKNKTWKLNNTKMPNLVSVTISLKQIRCLRWCFQIPRASVSQDKTGVKWSTKALCRHSGELMMCLFYHRQRMKEGKTRDSIISFLIVLSEIPRQPLYKERLDLLECQTFWNAKPFGFPNV